MDASLCRVLNVQRSHFPGGAQDTSPFVRSHDFVAVLFSIMNSHTCKSASLEAELKTSKCLRIPDWFRAGISEIRTKVQLVSTIWTNVRQFVERFPLFGNRSTLRGPLRQRGNSRPIQHLAHIVDDSRIHT